MSNFDRRVFFYPKLVKIPRPKTVVNILDDYYKYALSGPDPDVAETSKIR